MKCIYSIVGLHDGKRYIGSAVDFFRRRSEHIRDLRKGVHCAKYLQNAWNKYGESAFKFGILTIVDSKDKLIETEQSWLDGYDPEYNFCKVAGSILGTKKSPEARAKISASHFGIRPSFESRQKMSAAKKGKPLSVEQRAKMSAVRFGKTASTETRVKLSISASTWQRGRVLSPETRAKISAATKGKILSPETRAKMSAARRLAEANRRGRGY